jgi:hypothetical protein
MSDALALLLLILWSLFCGFAGGAGFCIVLSKFVISRIEMRLDQFDKMLADQDDDVKS